MAEKAAIVVRISDALAARCKLATPDVKFGKTDRVLKLPVYAEGSDTGAAPVAVLFLGRSGRTFVADFMRYPEGIKSVMIFHGTKQKLGDEYADLDSEEDCFESVISLDGRLAEGKWSADRQGIAGISVLMKAIMKVFSLSEDQAREYLKPLTKAEKDALRVCEELKATIDEIEREKGKGANVSGIIEKLKAAKQ